MRVLNYQEEWPLLYEPADLLKNCSEDRQPPILWTYGLWFEAWMARDRQKRCDNEHRLLVLSAPEVW